MNPKATPVGKPQQCLLDLVAHQLFSSETEVQLLSEELENVLQEALIQTVPLIAFSGLSLEKLPTETQNRIRLILTGYVRKNALVGTAHGNIHRLMTDAGIPYVIIKGLASALYYPDYLMRLMGDVDFLVDRSDFARADEVLQANGFVRKKRHNDHHAAYYKDGVRYELHYEPSGIPQGEVGERLRRCFDDLLTTAQTKSTELGEIRVPDLFHHGLIVLLHNVHHLTGDGLGLRHLCDWAVLIGSMDCQTFGDLFEKPLKDTGLWYFAGIMTHLCVEAFGCEDVMPQKGDPQRELCRQLLADVFEAGNFGQKSQDRSHESLLISSKNERGITEKSLFSQGVASLNRIVYSHWPIAKKVKILLPFGWLFYFGRYALRSVMGKRPRIRMKQVFSKAQKRKEFYNRLRLFEQGEGSPQPKQGEQDETKKMA